MKLIRAFIRSEVEQDVVLALEGAGHVSMTKFHVLGRGKQRGLKVGNTTYAELPKIMLALVVEDESVPEVKNIIIDKARTGSIGDGKIFVSKVDEAYTIRTGEAGL